MGSLRMERSSGDFARKKRMLFAGATKRSRMLFRIAVSMMNRSLVGNRFGSRTKLEKNSANGFNASWLPWCGVATKITRLMSPLGSKFTILKRCSLAGRLIFNFSGGVTMNCFQRSSPPLRTIRLEMSPPMLWPTITILLRFGFVWLGSSVVRNLSSSERRFAADHHTGSPVG